MRVSPIGPVCPAKNRAKAVSVKEFPSITEPVSFKANLKAGDYIVGAICGSAMAAVGFMVAGPLGAVALGVLGAKTTAEANNDSRPAGSK